jgi:hypothetical protein
MNAEMPLSPAAGEIHSGRDHRSGIFSLWELLICFLGLLNLVIFGHSVLWIVLGKRTQGEPGMYLLWIGVVACAVAIARFRGRRPDSRVDRLRVLLLSIFAAPLLLLLLWHLLAGVLLFPLAALHSVARWLRPPEILMGYLMGPSLGAYYTLPTFKGVVYVGTTVGFLVFALRRGTWRVYPWKMAGLGLVTILFAWYVLWWHLTGQKWVFL